MNYITDYLARNARTHANKPAFICADRTLTWQQLDTDVSAFAAQLPRGEQQQVIGILLPNSWQFVVAYLAALRAGHIALPLDPSYKKLEIAGIAEQVQPVVTITHTARSNVLPAHFERILLDDHVPLAANRNFAAPKQPATQQIASLLFTSGTTGRPKITAYTHANHLWNIKAVAELWQWTPHDTLLLSLPLSHWHGLVMGVAGALYHANTVYLHERFGAEATVRALQNDDVSLFMHVPVAYFKLVEYAGRKKYDISKVRLCVSGSSYLPPSIWRGFKKAFGQEILERYGSSETGLIASHTLDQRKPGTVGKVLPGVEVRREPGGELAMQSSGRFAGYYKNPEATRQNTTPDGMWLTGDIGDFTKKGELVLHGRLQEKIKKLGYTVYPRDVEWAVMKHPLIHDITVVGLQKTGLLSDIIVYFIIAPKLANHEIAAYCKEHLPAAWRPDHIVHLAEIPKTRSGKPKLAELRTMLQPV